MTLPVVTALPTAPSRSDVPATFITRADAFVGALATLVSDINAFGTALPAEADAINYNGTSTTSLAIAIGSKSLTVETGKLFQVGQFVTIANTATPANYMYGQVTAYTSGTGALVVNVTRIGGTGTLAAWTVAIAVDGAAIAPTGTGFRRVTAGVEDAAAVGETGTDNVVRSASPTLTGAIVANATLALSGAGVPLTVNSTNSNGSKVLFQDAGVAISYFGSDATLPFSLLIASGGTPFSVNSAGNMAIAYVTAGASAGARFHFNPASGAIGAWTTDAYSANAPISLTGSSVALNAGASTIATVSSTGVAVTGALSATGNASAAAITATTGLTVSTAGTTTVAPLKIKATGAALLTTPVEGTIETDGTDLYWTNSAGVRKKITVV